MQTFREFLEAKAVDMSQYYDGYNNIVDIIANSRAEDDIETWAQDMWEELTERLKTQDFPGEIGASAAQGAIEALRQFLSGEEELDFIGTGRRGTGVTRRPIQFSRN